MNLVSVAASCLTAARTTIVITLASRPQSH
ncbi:hypothetical protein JOD47_000438 [Arthrobacter tumbae]|nr:hypothetical protein [Arthrobacter tumbae]